MATLMQPPPSDPNRCMMENNIELSQLSGIDSDLFTNTRPLWHPPGQRGVFGGAVVAQCLSAAQHTVPNDFAVHSMHCHFLLAGRVDVPVVYCVQRLLDGRSFATRTVQARQRGKPIFTATLSFMKELKAGLKIVEHALHAPDVPELERSDPESILTSDGPLQSRRIKVVTSDLGEKPHEKRMYMWIKTRGQIASSCHQAHLTALAYMTDSQFISTVPRAHNLWRSVPATLAISLKQNEDSDKHMTESETGPSKLALHRDLAQRLRYHNDGKEANTENRPELEMMVSLNHAIFFHRPRDFRADEWMFSEMDTPWTGDGRGLVTQRIWTSDGKLIATCFQEGLYRLKQEPLNSKL